MGDGSQKWTTLEHAGVLFPPAYDPLPKEVKLHYDGAFPILVAILACFSHCQHMD